MIVTCPACSTRYSMEPAALGAEGRRVRCSKCRHEWFQTPPADLPRRVDIPPATPAPTPIAAPAVAPPQPAPIPMPPLPSAPSFERAPEPEPFVEPAPRPVSAYPRPEPVAIPPAPPPMAEPTKGGGFGFQLLLFIVVVAGILAAVGYLGRERIVEQWPQTKEIYDLLKIDVSYLGQGLEIDNVTFLRQTVDGVDRLSVQGAVRNIGNAPAAVPAILVTLSDDQRRPLVEWILPAQSQPLAPGETSAFATATDGPPLEAVRLIVTFTDRPV